MNEIIAAVALAALSSLACFNQEAEDEKMNKWAIEHAHDQDQQEQDAGPAQPDTTHKPVGMAAGPSASPHLDPMDCPAQTIHEVQPNGAFADFALPKGRSGDVKAWTDGSASTYRFPTCHRIIWMNVRASCIGDKWTMNPSASFDGDLTCQSDNAVQPGLTTGAM